MGADPNLPDKNMLYGIFQKQEDITNGRLNKQLNWEDDYKRKLIHKSTDIPISPKVDDMNVDARKSYTASGLDWKHLAVIAATGLGGLGLFKFSPNPSAPTTQQPPAISQDYTTQIEIRDAITKKPIKIDWLNGNSSSSPAPQRNDNPPPLYVAPK